MLNKNAFANSLAIITGGCYLLFYVVNLVAPQVFAFLYNAQFFGANVASLLPQEFSLGDFVGTFAVLAVTAWLVGYFWAWLYNRLSKQ